MMHFAFLRNLHVQHPGVVHLVSTWFCEATKKKIISSLEMIGHSKSCSLFSFFKNLSSSFLDLASSL
ncbi:hypothetical protein NC652_030971 [Populus alba x Populus x berolinensis]|nr:hypothetical protein NC652_030971 [Populus alba x Populus x berolinensis]